VEVMSMRALIVVVGLAVLAIVGYSFRAVPVRAQTAGDWLPFTAGEALRLDVDLPQGVLVCKVTQVQNGFIGCARDEQNKTPERWINLRFVKVITPRER
jgi:hypothetical protein